MIIIPVDNLEGRDPLLEGIATGYGGRLLYAGWREGRDPLLEGIATVAARL